jgi:hypothetical protein
MYRDGAISNKATVRFYYQSTVSVDESINSSNTFRIYPNPAGDYITIDIYENYIENSTLNIYNTLGSLIKTETLNQNKKSINVSELSNGLYFVIIISKELTQSQKLIIQR